MIIHNENIEEQLTEQDYLNFLDSLDDFPSACEEHLKIKNEDGEIVPFVLNELQLYVWGIIKSKLDVGEKIRLLVLKCRQTGISTMIEAFLYLESVKDAYQKMLVLGHESKSSANLYDMFQRYYDYSPSWMQMQVDTNQREKKLKYKYLENEIDIQTAGANVDSQKAGTGRSSTYQYIHATECAFYPDYVTTFLGLLQASKKAKMIVLETTANGFNEFRNDWVEAKEGLNEYVPVFLAWIDFKTYTKPFDSEAVKQIMLRDLGSNPRYNEFIDEEKLLIEDHHCTLEQLNWRRWAIDNLCKGKVVLFHQEYPTTDKEAFISTGSAFFNKLIVNSNYENSEDFWKVGNLEYVYDANKKPYDVKFVEDPNGYVGLHYGLQLDINDVNRFAGGTDVSEGLEQGDRSIMKIMDRKHMNVCITWRPSIHPDLLGIEQHKISLFLNNDVYFNTERNNHGLTTITKSYSLGVSQYYQQNFENGYTIDDTTKLGYRQNESTRRYLVDSLQEAIREGSFVDIEQEAWSEAMTFVRNSKGKVQAQNKDKDPASKCYDDRIFAWGLMWICHLWMPKYTTRVVEEVPAFMKEHIERQRRKKKAGYRGTTVMSG